MGADMGNYVLIFSGGAEEYVYDNYWLVVAKIDQPAWWTYNGLEIGPGSWGVAISQEHTSRYQAQYQADRFPSGGHAAYVFDNFDHGLYYQPWRGEWAQAQDAS